MAVVKSGVFVVPSGKGFLVSGFFVVVSGSIVICSGMAVFGYDSVIVSASFVVVSVVVNALKIRLARAVLADLLVLDQEKKHLLLALHSDNYLFDKLVDIIY